MYSVLLKWRVLWQDSVVGTGKPQYQKIIVSEINPVSPPLKMLDMMLYIIIAFM